MLVAASCTLARAPVSFRNRRRETFDFFITNSSRS
jgi:hypothetical protein